MIRRALKRFWEIIAKALQQGTSPRMLAITCALGAVLAVLPVYGLTTLLCFLVAFVFRLNVVVIQAVNYLMTPLQLVLMIPFMQAGIFVFSLKPVILDFNELLIRFKRDFVTVLTELGSVMLGGIAVWVLVAVPFFFVLFFTFHWLLLRWKRRASAPAA
jgi:uncharacterized protein (DUF2062 family)